MDPDERLARLSRELAGCRVALQASEERFRTYIKRFEDIAANALEWIWEVDVEGRYTYASPVVEKILGYTPAEVLDKHFYDLFHAEDREPLKAAAFAVFARKEPFREFVNRNVHRDGQTVWLSTSGVPILGPNGELLGYRGADTDITEQRRSAEDLRRSEAEFRLAFESSKDAIFWADPETGVITRCNRAAELLLERDRNEILGMHQTDLHPPEKAEQFAEMFRIHLDRGGVAEDEAEVVTASGKIKRVLITTSVPVVEGKPLIQGVFHDITDRKRAEEERRRIEEKMQQAQKLESLGVLAGGIAHDFNNLLMGILGNAGLAIMALKPESPARVHLATIETTTKRAAELTNQLLAYSGKGRFVVQSLNLSSLVDEMGHLLETVVSKKATIKTDFNPDLPAFLGDASQIRQVVMNLITNASDAIGERSGTITVTTGVQDVDERYLAEAYASNDIETGTYVFVEVSDSGGGMDAETIARMFDPFYSTKLTGRGLGLAAVIGIVRGHRGAIKVYSELERGTTVKVLLPAVGEARQANIIQPRDALGWTSEGLVLVVDDEQVVLDTAQQILRSVGFTVITARDGREGVETFFAHVEEVRLVLLDMTMPEMGGREVFTALRRLQPNVKVILTSGYNEQETTAQFAGKSLAGFIQKPYTPQQLIDLVRGILEV